jgi:hypothetical protein
MTRKLLISFVVVLALAGGALAEAASPAKTKLTISASAFEGVNTFSGFVISKKDGCHNGRTVRVYERVGRSRNLKRDEKIGSDRATPNGDGSQYRVDTEEGGTFYAYVKATRKCKAAFSKAISQPEPEEAPEEQPEEQPEQ